MGRAWYHSPSRAMRAISGVIRATSSSSIMAWSATSSMKTSGTLVTTIPAAVAAATSTMSTPTPPTPITTHCLRPSMTSWSMEIPHEVMTASRSPTAAGELGPGVGGDLDDVGDGRQGLELVGPALLDRLGLHLPRKPNSNSFLRHAAGFLVIGPGLPLRTWGRVPSRDGAALSP